VTKEAERQARQAIRRARKDNPNAKIIVTGCSAQISPEKYAEMPEVDRIIGNDLKLKAETWGGGAANEARILVNDIMSVRETASHLVEGFEGRARAFIQVQNGCDHRCTFCIIPYGRGNSRSVPIGEIVNQVKALVASGYNEIVITGVDVTSYGPDLPGSPTLGQMIRRVLALVPELPRLRLSSLDPVEMDDDLWRLIAEEPRLMPHLHMSLQAGDDMILKRMKRRHLRADAIEMCRRARSYRPDIAFGADIIAGFPTETEGMFLNTLNIVEECDLTFLHVFPYSERPGTPAAKMPQVFPEVRKERAARLRAKGEEQLTKFLKFHVKQDRQVIVEKDNFGHTEHFAPVRLDRTLPAGSLVSVSTLSVTDGHLDARIIP
jgi:threonylcarbamoyladenosine tRNA methylthiotransferase MtaB